MPRIGDTRPDPQLRPASSAQIQALLDGGLGCLVKKGRVK